jgi:hypothetical protein
MQPRIPIFHGLLKRIVSREEASKKSAFTSNGNPVVSSVGRKAYKSPTVEREG